MLPIVLSESVLQLFKFYRDGSIREGILHHNELYGLTYEFSTEHRLRGYQIACELAQQGTPVVVSVSSHRYVIWIGLRSPIYEQGSSFELPTSILPEKTSLLLAS